MTAYPPNFFDSSVGILEHLIIAVVAQKMANSNYIPSSLETDFTTNAIDWYVQSDQLTNSISPDNGAALDTANLYINVTLPVIAYDLSILRQIDPDISRRVASINPVNVADLGVSTEDTYEQKSFLAKYPEYLLDFTSDTYQLTNTLERRVMNLCLQVLGYCRWIDRYNYIVELINIIQASIDATTATSILALPNNIDIPTLEGMRQTLIAELSSAEQLSLDISTPIIFTYDPSVSLNTDGSSGGDASGQGDSFGGTDPSTSTELSQGLLELLSDSSNAFGSASDSPQGTGNDPTPTLSDC